MMGLAGTIYGQIAARKGASAVDRPQIGDEKWLSAGTAIPRLSSGNAPDRGRGRYVSRLPESNR